jgi:hypothetical protein
VSFRERTLWAALLGNLLVWGGYFIWLARRIADGGMEAIPHPSFLIGIVVWLIIYTAVAAAVVQLLSRRDADRSSAALDEREQAIAWRAGAAAYGFLSLLLVLVIGGMFTGWGPRVIINALLFALILAESVRYGIELRALRT